MPHCKNLESLENLSLFSVVQNMESEWCKHYVEAYKEMGFFRFVAGPFNNVPSMLLVKLIKALREQKRLKKHNLELLVVSQLDTLDLSREHEDVCHALKLVLYRCSNLKVLRLSYCQKIPKFVYQEIFPQLVELQILDLSGTKSGDKCLCIIGAYCKILRELNITSCPVTDEGIRGLCGSVDNFGLKNFGQCRQISKLYINYTNITDQGIAIALTNLKNLQILDCCGSVQVLAQMHQFAYKNHMVDISKYILLNLDCSEFIHMNYVSQSLYKAIELCPSVTKIRLVTQPELTDTDLKALVYLQNLQELCISGGKVCIVSFSNGIEPVLKASGERLQSLTLAELSNVDVDVIVEYCQNLKSLQLIMNHSYEIHLSEGRAFVSKPKKLDNPSRLSQLKSLHLVCLTHLELLSDIPSSNLLSLLTSEQLAYIYIKECSTLNDTIFRAVYGINKFPNLEHLELEKCDGISENAIGLLINSSNPIKTLKLWECRQLTKRSFIGWKKLAKASKWELSLNWS